MAEGSLGRAVARVGQVGQARGRAEGVVAVLDGVRRIWKYTLPLEIDFKLLMPRGAEVIHFGLQNDVPQIWVLVDLREPEEVRSFFFRDTGMTVSASACHVGTVLLYEGDIVRHLFEEVGRG